MHDLEELIHDLETAMAAADAAADAAVSLAETTAQGARQAVSAGRTVLKVLENTIQRLATVAAPPDAAPIETVAGATVFYCQGTNCRGLGWRPRADMPHPRTCLPDDAQTAWPGLCGLER